MKALINQYKRSKKTFNKAFSVMTKTIVGKTIRFLRKGKLLQKCMKKMQNSRKVLKHKINLTKKIGLLKWPKPMAGKL